MEKLQEALEWFNAHKTVFSFEFDGKVVSFVRHAKRSFLGQNGWVVQDTKKVFREWPIEFFNLEIPADFEINERIAINMWQNKRGSGITAEYEDMTYTILSYEHMRDLINMRCEMKARETGSEYYHYFRNYLIEEAKQNDK